MQVTSQALSFYLSSPPSTRVTTTTTTTTEESSHNRRMTSTTANPSQQHITSSTSAFHTEKMMTTMMVDSDTASAGVTPTTAPLHHKNNETQKFRSTSSSRSNSTTTMSVAKQRRGGRLWQLPETSIQEYASWIQTKPLSDQSIAEQRFLWKYQRRLLVRRNKLPTERLRDYISRLEQKQNPTPMETQLIMQFHRQRKDKKSSKKKQQQGGKYRGIHPHATGEGLVDVPPQIFWTRNNKSSKKASESGTLNDDGRSNSSAVLNMASLRASMDRLGLSTDTLRTTSTTMEDAR